MSSTVQYSSKCMIDPDLVLFHQYSICDDKVDVIEVVRIELELTSYGDEIVNPKGAGVFCEINLGNGLRSASTAKEALTHRVL